METPASSEQTTVRVESKRAVLKLKEILCNHHTTVSTISPFDGWCDRIVVDDIKKEDILDTVNKPISTTQYQHDVHWETFINSPGSIFKHQGYLYGRHVHHKKGIPVECDKELQWNLNHTQTRVVKKLIIICSLQENPKSCG
jgi:hypothetical protein